MTPDQDERLLAQQFETIFTKYYSVVKYFALMLLKSEEDSKDITPVSYTHLRAQETKANLGFRLSL